MFDHIYPAQRLLQALLTSIRKVANEGEEPLFRSHPLTQDPMRSENLREELRQITKHWPKVLDILIQSAITWMTAKPHWGQQPLLKLTPSTYLLIALSELAIGVTSSNAILHHASPALLPLLFFSYLMTVGGGRIVETTINHQAAHSNFSGNKFWDRWVLEILSTLLMIQPYDGYVRDHIGNQENDKKGHHNKSVFATKADPAYQLILKLFPPNLTKQEYWLRLRRTVCNLYFHWFMLRERLKSNLLEVPGYRRLMAICWYLIGLSLVGFTQSWITFFVAWCIPLTILHHISALLFALTEHLWGDEDEQQPWRVRYMRRTCGRFSGEPFPAAHFRQNPWTWVLWVLRWVFIHIPVRLGCWVGEGPEHDWHHRHVNSRDWANGAFARQRDLEAGCPGWPEPYTEVWGIIEALDRVFEALSRSEP